MNKQLQKDITKHLKNVNVSSELPPGADKRRYEPEGGLGNHNKRIHKESDWAKKNKNLPFSFRKPPKPVGRSKGFECPECGAYLSGTDKTVCIICSGCNKLIKF